MHQECGYQHVEDGVVKITFVKSAKNFSDILIKKLSADLNEKHLKTMVGEKHKDFPSFKIILCSRIFGELG